MIELGPIDFDPRHVTTQRGQLVEDVPGFGIRPADIDTSRHFFGAYGNMETEVSAGWIVRMCQQRGSWESFTSREIEDFYRAGGQRDGFTFNQLVGPQTGFFIAEGYVPVGGGWIVERDGQYHLTTAFVQAAYRSSPTSAIEQRRVSGIKVFRWPEQHVPDSYK